MELIAEFVVARVAEHYRKVHGEPASKAKLDGARETVEKLFNDPHSYHRYAVRNGKVSALVHAWKSPAPGAKTVFVHPWLPGDDGLTRSEAKSELAAIGAFFGKKLCVKVALFPEQTQLRSALEKLGFGLDAYELTGKVADGRRYTSGRLKGLDRSGFILSRMNFKRDLSAVLRLDELCHQANPSSTGFGLPRAASRRDMTAFFKTATSGRNRVLLMKQGKNLAGVVGVTFHPKHRDTALLGTITVAPQHQGRGLANWLYFEALTLMQKNGAKWYTGFSTTDRVLKHAKSMKRCVSAVVLSDAPWAKR